MQAASGYGGSNRRMLDEVVDVELATSGQYQQQVVPQQQQQQTFSVKQERHDDQEINELAAKIVESNKAHLAKQQQQQALQQQQLLRQQQLGTAGGGGGGPLAGTNGNGNILNYFGRKTTTAGTTTIPGTAAAAAQTLVNGNATGMATVSTGGGGGVVAMASNDSSAGGGGGATAGDEKKPPSDEESQLGHFGWHSCNKTAIIPYIVRAGEKYCAVRIVETKLLNKYLNYLHQDIYNCTCVRSYYITEAECRLLNEINMKHCDNQFGRELFTHKDLVVRLSDVNKFYTFLDVCYRKLMMGNSGTHSEKCGFIRINKESVVPYTVRDNQKYVPLFYFEGETENLKLKADHLSGWDLSYLKFCCKVQGIRNELFASDQVAVISLTDIKSYFPPGIEFEDYWPNKVVDSQLLITKNGANGGNGANGLNGGGVHWTRQPTQPPQKPQTQQQQQQQVKTTPNQGLSPHAMIAAAQMQAQASSVANIAGRAKQQSVGMLTSGAVGGVGAATVNHLVYNATNGARGGGGVAAAAAAAGGNANVSMMEAAARNPNINAARLVANVWSNMEQYQRMAETNAYAGNPMQSFNYMRAMQGQQNGSAAGAGQAAPPPLVRGSASQAGAAAGRTGNAQHMSSGLTGASSYSTSSTTTATKTATPSLSLLVPSQSPSALLSPPLLPPAPSPSHSHHQHHHSKSVLQHVYQAQQQQQQQQQNAAASMAATISYLHSSLSMTPTSPQTSSTAGTPVPIDIGQVFGVASPPDPVTKANSSRTSVVVQQQQQKVIPPPPSLIPMSAAGSLFASAAAGASSKDLLKIQDTLQQLHNLKNVTATFSTAARRQETSNNNNNSTTTGSRGQMPMDPLSLAGYGHYKNNPNLATIRLAGQQQQQHQQLQLQQQLAGSRATNLLAYGNSGSGGVGGGGSNGNNAVQDYLLRAAAAAAKSATVGLVGNSGRAAVKRDNHGTNLNTNSSHYLNQMLLSNQSGDVIDLSSNTPTRSNAAAVAALQQQYQQQQQQQYYLQQAAAQQQQQQQQAQQQQAAQQRAQSRSNGSSSGGGGVSNGGSDTALANCLNLLAGGHAAAAAAANRGRQGSAMPEDYSAAAAVAMNKATMQQNMPYKIHKAVIDNVQVSCINMKAYVHQDLLMRVQDLCDKFFPQSTHENCRRVLEVFNVVIYRGNSQQIKLFSSHFNQRSDYMELVQVKDVMNYMPQLRYIIKSQSQDSMQQAHHQAPPSKRTRIS